MLKLKLQRRHWIHLLIALVLFVGLVSGLVWLGQPEPQYRIEFLPEFFPGGRVIPMAVNDAGSVIGVAEWGVGLWHGFVWDRDRGMRDLGPSADRGVGKVIMLNHRGGIVFTSVDPNGDRQTHYLDPNDVHHPIQGPVGADVFPLAMNQQGRVVGYYTIGRGSRQAFMWGPDEGFVDCTVPNSLESLLCCINDRGQVLGFSSEARTTQWYAFYSEPDLNIMNLGPTSKGYASSCYINKHGRVVGDIGPDENQMFVATWSLKDGLQRGPRFRGNHMQVTGFNDSGQFVVQVDRRRFGLRPFGLQYDTHAYLCNLQGDIKNIGKILDRQDVLLFRAAGLNNHGQIVGQLATTADPIFRGVILHPIDSPR